MKYDEDTIGEKFDRALDGMPKGKGFFTIAAMQGG
jgi:hypothetical protein